MNSSASATACRCPGYWGNEPMACPICRKDTDPKYRPFCSRRCADVDLGRWLTGAYSIPAQDEDEAEEDCTRADHDRPH